MTSRETWQRRSRSNRRWLPALLLAAALASGCGGSASKPKPKPPVADDRAGLVFTRQSGQVSGVWIANADGSNPRQIVANGSGGTLSPDGRWITYVIPVGKGHTTNIKDVVRGDPRPLGEVGVLAWSPNGERLAVRAERGLFLVDPFSGTTVEVAHGDVDQASFSPDGKEIAFARANRLKPPRRRSDIFTAHVNGGTESPLTSDGHSDHPVWGRGGIVYRHFRFVNAEHWPAIGELRVVQPNGIRDRIFQRGYVDPSQARWGLEPVEFSENGGRLLACVSAEFSCQPIVFDFAEGGRGRELSVEDGGVSTALDFSTDGSEVLVEPGGVESPMNIYSVPFDGGAARLLVKGAQQARWAG